MYTITVNDKDYTFEQDYKLLDVLRNKLKLKSVKDGCSEGACGTCTVLVDGKPVKACVQKISRFEGKKILTVEGFSDYEKELYVYAYGAAGAVQCGFCIPGMVICTKALLDLNPSPTRAEITEALKNNYCRCTGYKKIIDAVEIAAELKRTGKPIPKPEKITGIGQRAARIDVREKVLGEGKYVDDYDEKDFPNMLYCSALRSAYPRARVLSIDTSEAKKVEGIVCVATEKDIPGQNKIGHIKSDWATLIKVGNITRYLGDAIALVCGENLEAVEKAKKLIKVEYEVLPAVFDPIKAMERGSPFVHKEGNILAFESLKRGDADEAIKNSAYVVTNEYETPFTEHALLEPECAIATCNSHEE